MQTKVCISCKETKPKTSEYFFYRNKARGWLSSWCMVCRKANRDNEKELAWQRIRRGNAVLVRREKAGPRMCRDCKDVEMAPRQRLCDPCKKKVRQAQHRREKAFRKKHVRQATPAWADRDAIREIYKNTPEGHHVDHIIPLRGKNVSGLHIAENLQYLPALENMKKGNKILKR